MKNIKKTFFLAFFTFYLSSDIKSMDFQQENKIQSTQVDMNQIQSKNQKEVYISELSTNQYKNSTEQNKEQKLNVENLHKRIIEQQQLIDLQNKKLNSINNSLFSYQLWIWFFGIMIIWLSVTSILGTLSYNNYQNLQNEVNELSGTVVALELIVKEKCGL